MTSKAGNPFFSIITCTYNSEKFVHNNITSVKQQTFKDYEHIFIDAYSSDDTIKIIDDYIDKVKTNVRRRQYAPAGIADAMNKGIAIAKGAYIIILHSDDSFYNNAVLDNAHKFLINNIKQDWVYGRINVINGNHNSIGVFPTQMLFKIANAYILKFINFVPHQAVIMKKSVFDKNGMFDSSLKYAMDTDMWLRIRNKTRWKYMPLTIANYMVRKDAQSSSKKNATDNLEILMQVKARHLNNVEMILFRLLQRYVIGKRTMKILQ